MIAARSLPQGGAVLRRALSAASSPGRDYDLVLFGATGFAGRLAAEYALRAHGGLRIALAGRDGGKLEALRESLGATDVGIVVADASDDGDVARVAASATCVATTAGPFAKFGSGLLGACAAAGTHYCDITGEAAWIALMAHEHDAAARASGASIVPAAGFDSVPSDLGTFLAVAHHEETFGEKPERVDAFYTAMRGAFQGGTIDTVVNEMDNPTPRAPRGASSAFATKIDWSRGRPFKTVTLRGKRLHSSPFIMAGANAPCVRRSNALLGYRDGFVYSESMALPSLKAALANAATIGVGAALLGFAPARNFIRDRGYLPKPGQGPSRAKMERGNYAASFVSESAAGTTTTEWRGAGDPSCISTTIFLVETAVGLVERGDAAPAGIQTPASALGHALVAKLRDAKWQPDDATPAIRVEQVGPEA